MFRQELGEEDEEVVCTEAHEEPLSEVQRR